MFAFTQTHTDSNICTKPYQIRLCWDSLIDTLVDMWLAEFQEAPKKIAANDCKIYVNSHWYYSLQVPWSHQKYFSNSVKLKLMALSIRRWQFTSALQSVFSSIFFFFRSLLFAVTAAVSLSPSHMIYEPFISQTSHKRRTYDSNSNFLALLSCLCAGLVRRNLFSHSQPLNHLPRQINTFNHTNFPMHVWYVKLLGVVKWDDGKRLTMRRADKMRENIIVVCWDAHSFR